MRYLILAPATPDQLDRARDAFAAVAHGPTAEHTAAAPSGRAIHVLLETPDSPNVPPRVPVLADDRRLIFYDGLPLHPDFDAFDARALEQHWSRVPELLARHTVVRLDKQTGSLELFTDAIAACPPYRAAMAGGAWAITNVPRLAHRLAERSGLDPLGAAGLVCTPTPLADRTLIESVRTVPCASRLTATPDTPPAIETNDRLVAAGRHPCDLSPAESAERFAAVYGPIIARLHEAGFDVRCALTGGRDSRALSALTASVLDRPRFHFGGQVGKPESLTAERVAAILGGDFELKADANEPDAHNFNAAERHLLDRDCGMIVYSYLRPAPDTEPDPNDHREVHLTGHAGEIARWSFESLTGTITPPSIAASRARLRMRMVSAGSGLFASDAVRLCADHVNALIDAAVDAGVTRSNLQTVVANQLKAPRWAALHITRSAERRDVIAPFLTPPFFDVAMRLHPRHRFNDAFHKALIRRSCPEALSVPFHSYTSTLQRLRNELARNAMSRLPGLKKSYAKRQSPGRHARWEPWLRPILRDRLLAHDHTSPVWAYLDRPHLEGLLTDETGEPFRTRVYDVFKAATLIRFWDWYNDAL